MIIQNTFTAKPEFILSGNSSSGDHYSKTAVSAISMPANTRNNETFDDNKHSMTFSHQAPALTPMKLNGPKDTRLENSAKFAMAINSNGNTHNNLLNVQPLSQKLDFPRQ
jgi:hypothetical protein